MILQEHMKEKEYRQSSRLSYSFLKDFNDNGPEVLLTGMKKRTSSGFSIGNLVDEMTTLNTKDILRDKENVVVSDIDLNMSGDTHSSKIYSYLIANNIILSENDYESLSEICKKLGFKRPPKFDQLFWKNILLVNYVIQGFTIVSNSDLDLANTMYDTLVNHPFTTKIFRKDTEEIETINQAIIFFIQEGEECKAMIDKMRIDHKNKIIYPFDIKTGYTYAFLVNFYKFKYYLQGSLYSKAIEYMIENDPKYKGYTVDTFKFIYVSRENPLLPVVYEMEKEFINDAYNGWTSLLGKEMKGIKTMLNDITWHKQNSMFSISRELHSNNGNILLKNHKIV